MHATPTSQVRYELLERRGRLLQAAATLPDGDRLRRLIDEVDAALGRIDAGRFGYCETCHEPIEPDRLATDPLVQYCVDHLTPDGQRALQQDLDLAWRIQSQLLPRSDLRAGCWEASFHYQPLGPASGDCCDLLALEPDKVFFLLGDVMGKGLAASMLMSHVQAIFRSLAPMPLGLAELVERANRVFSQSTAGTHFATLVCGRLGPGGEIEYVNAGHCPPILLREDATTTLDPTGLPLGLFTGAPYREVRLRLSPGEALLIYTDGVTEARNEAGEEYGVERLAASARAGLGRGDAGAIRACLDDQTAFRGPSAREDDLTLLFLRRAVEAPGRP